MYFRPLYIINGESAGMSLNTKEGGRLIPAFFMYLKRWIYYLILFLCLFFLRRFFLL
jgi:hypothetical protein